MVENLICLVIGYFCGCISSGYFVGKFYHIDIREEGSGNAGTTNVLRTLGKFPALITFVGDIAKAAVPLLIVRFVFGTPEEWYLACLYTGLGVVLGHNYPFYMGFKGGKGIAVTAAVVMFTSHPLMVPIGIIVFVSVVAISHYVSLGSLFVAWYIPVNTLILYNKDSQFLHMMVVSLIFTALAYFQHRQNIVRIFKGTENKLWGNKKDKEH